MLSEPVIPGVLDAAVLDEQTEEVIAVGLAVPAQQITLTGELERARRFELDVGAFFHFGAAPIRTPFGQHIFEPGVFAIGAVAEIPMDGNDRLRHSFKMLGRQKSNDIRHARKRLRVAVGHAHAATREQIVADQMSVLGNDHKTQVMRENVNVVQRRNCKAGLKLARQVAPAIQRISKTCIRFTVEIQLLAVQPNPVVRGRLRAKRI